MSRLAAALGVVAVLLLAACEGEEVPDDTVDRNDRRVQEIVERLDDPTGAFTKFTGTYRDDFDAREKVTVVIHCESCRAARVIGQVVEAVWTSDIAPLHIISVSVDGPDGYVFEDYLLPDDEAELTERYGERPRP